jgi:ketosteroid isomerase-like protein
MDVNTAHPDARIQELLDKDAIRDVLARYVRGIDRYDLDLVRSVFHPDAIESHGPFQGLSHEWIDTFDPEEFQTVERHHQLGQSIIELHGDIAYSETYVILARGHEHGGEEPNLVLLHGRYVDKLERRDGEWKIARRHATIDYASQLTTSAWAATAAFIRGKRHPEDIVYQHVTMDDDAPVPHLTSQ